MTKKINFRFEFLSTCLQDLLFFSRFVGFQGFPIRGHFDRSNHNQNLQLYELRFFDRKTTFSISNQQECKNSRPFP